MNPRPSLDDRLAMRMEELPERPDGPPAPSKMTRGPLRWLLLSLGTVLTALAAVGAFLPVLPTTPFLILAAACFVRSSPTFHARLLENRVFGPYLKQWEKDHTIPMEAKRKAYGLILVTFGVSIFVVGATALRIMLVVIALALCALLAWLPTTESE